MSGTWESKICRNIFLDKVFALIYLYSFIHLSHDQLKGILLQSEWMGGGSVWGLKEHRKAGTQSWHPEGLVRSFTSG